jgi:hypothetical protein
MGTEMKYQPNKDSGTLNASKIKKHEKSPDYWGQIAIDVNDLTNVERVGDLLIFRLNGWKKTGRDGTTYLSISVNRFVPKAKPSGDMEW